MRVICLALLILLAGCANPTIENWKASPYFGYKFVIQHDRGSDWVLQNERPWVCGKNIDSPTGCESETRMHIEVGLEWDNRLDCPYVERVLSGPWDWMGVGCKMAFGKDPKGDRPYVFFIEPAIVHQVDSQTSGFLRTDQKQWQGHNPFMHVRLGGEGGGFRCPVIASGKSIFQGAPFEKEEGEPDLYWVNFECGVRLWGKSGLTTYWEQQ